MKQPVENKSLRIVIEVEDDMVERVEYALSRINGVKNIIKE